MNRSYDCWDACTHREIAENASRMLWRFIQPNARENEIEEVIENISGLGKRDLSKFAGIRFLLSSRTRFFLEDIAPRIIMRLSKTSIYEYTKDRSVKGRIVWPRTINARAASGGDKTLYVYAKKSQVFDLPENRVFLFILKHIYDKARSFVPNDYEGSSWFSDTDTGRRWGDRLSVIASYTGRMLRNPYTARISHTYELSDQLIEKARLSRQACYRDMVDIAFELMQSINSPVAYLNNELKGNILEPLSRDTLFEVAVLFTLIKVATDCGWKEKRAGLIGGSSTTISELIFNEINMKLYYQKLPESMKQNSLYGELMTLYGLSEKLRRPDIIIEINMPNKLVYLIVEVKRSQNRGYLVDGAYKLLGYLKDFEAVKTESTELKGVLISWKGINSVDDLLNDEIRLLSWDNIYKGFCKYLSDT